jgi:hypothetical protein
MGLVVGVRHAVWSVMLSNGNLVKGKVRMKTNGAEFVSVYHAVKP